MFISKRYSILLQFTRTILRNFQYTQKTMYHRFEEVKPYSVYITRTVNEEATDILEKSCDIKIWEGTDPVPRDVLEKELKDRDGLFCMLTDKIDEQLLAASGDKLKVVATMSVGYDHLDLKALEKRKIRVGYTPDVLTDATAELTLALLLATSRRLFEANKAARNGEWKTWSPFWMCGPGLKGSTVGIFGFGRIGQQVARLIKPFNVKELLFTSKSQNPTRAQLFHATQVPFEELLKRSDFLIVTCSLTKETENLFNVETFSQMKSNAIFINTSRGGIVDQKALVYALKNKIIFGAGLDVTTPEPLPVDHELFELENCVILPHIGSAATETRKEMGILTAQNILCGLKGDPMPSELKFK